MRVSVCLSVCLSIVYVSFSLDKRYFGSHDLKFLLVLRTLTWIYFFSFLHNYFIPTAPFLQKFVFSLFLIFLLLRFNYLRYYFWKKTCIVINKKKTCLTLRLRLKIEVSGVIERANIIFLSIRVRIFNYILWVIKTIVNIRK